MRSTKIIAPVILIIAVIAAQVLYLPSASAGSGIPEVRPSFWTVAVEKVKAFFKGKPGWERIVERRLSEIRNDPAIRVLPSLAGNPTCWVDPVRDDILQQIGRSTLQGDGRQAEAWTHRFARYLLCINSRGMGIWDKFFSDVHQDCLSLSKKEKNKCLRATTGPALMVSDYFLNTGYTAVQRTIREYFTDYQRAYWGQRDDLLFCINHNNGSMLRFGSGRGEPVLRLAVTALANHNSELGLGLCSLCEMANAGFQGICDRGLEQILQCLRGGEEGPVQGEFLLSDIRAEQDPNAFNGTSEQQLRLAACGLRMDGMSSHLGAMNPGSNCLLDMAAALREQQRAQNRDQRAFDCYQRIYGRSFWDWIEPKDGGAGAALDQDCSMSTGGGRGSSEHMTYQNSALFSSSDTVRKSTPWGERDIRIGVDIRVNGDGYFQANVGVTMTNPESGTQTLLDPAAYARGEFEPIGVGTHHGEPSSASGRLTPDDPRARAAMNFIVNAVNGEGGSVEPCQGDSQECRDANMQAQALVDEARRRASNDSDSGSGGSSGTTNPGPEGYDTCSAEARRLRAFSECTSSDEMVNDSSPLDPLIQPADPDTGSAPAGAFSDVSCLIASGGGDNVRTTEGGDIDRCLSGDDPTCFMATGEAMEHDPHFGTVDPNPNDDDPCTVPPGEPVPESCDRMGGGRGGGDPNPGGM